MLVSGKSGEGKTALIEHFLKPLRQDRAVVVMSGRCYDRESVPFKALDTLIDALTGYLRSLPGEDAALLMPDDIAVLAQVFPVLQRVEVVAKRVSLTKFTEVDEQPTRQRAFRALRLVVNLISQMAPLVWFVDDLQWGDADSAEALFEVLRPPEAPQLLFLGSFRSDEAEDSPFLNTWNELQLDSLIDTLSSYLRSLGETQAALLMPDDIDVLAQLFPVLQRVSVVEQSANANLNDLDPKQIRQRAFVALRSLLKRISRSTFVVWFVDDLQWGDAESAEVLFEVLRPPEAPPILFLGSYRSDEREGSAFLNTWKALQRKHSVSFSDQELSVGPLSIEESTDLMVQLLGQDNPTIREQMQQLILETGSNPFLLTELVECFRNEKDQFELLEVHEVFARKLNRLPSEAGPLLDAVVVSGQALPLAEACQAAGFVRFMSNITVLCNLIGFSILCAQRKFS